MEPTFPKISVLTASEPHRVANHRSDGNGGLYSQALAERIQNGHPLKQAHQELVQSGLQGIKPDETLNQRPQSYGLPVPNEVANPSSKNKGTAIVVTGQTKHAADKDKFLNDVKTKTTLYESLGYQVKTAETFDEFKKHLSDAKARGATEENDHLIVDASMHGSVLNSSISGTSPSATRPPSPNPNQEGVLLFRNPDETRQFGLKDSNLVHERDVFKPIVDAAESFDHTVCIFDSCYSGALNDQFLQSETNQPTPPIKYDDIYRSP